MANHPSILAWRIPWTEEPWRATVHGVAESDTTERLSTCWENNHSFRKCWVLKGHVTSAAPAILQPHHFPLPTALTVPPSPFPYTGLGQVGGVTEGDQCGQRWGWRTCPDLARCIHTRVELWDVGRLCLQLREREVSWASISGPVEETGGEQVLTRLSRSSLGRPLLGQLPSAVGPPKRSVARCLNTRTRRKQALRAGMLAAVLRCTSRVYTAAAAQTQLCTVLSYLSYARVYYFLPRTAGETGSVRLGRREGRRRENSSVGTDDLQLPWWAKLQIQS